MIINVTQNHIDLAWNLHEDWGLPDGEFCPIALSLKEQMNTEDVDVRDECIHIEDVQYKTPHSLLSFIRHFDRAVIESDPNILPTPITIQEELVLLVDKEC